MAGKRRGVAKNASGGGTWRTCVVGGCVYRTKRTDVLKKHKAAIHNIDIVWHACPELGCEYRAKQEGSVKVHRANVHGIDVTWHEYPEPNCTFKAKQEARSRGTEPTCMASASTRRSRRRAEEGRGGCSGLAGVCKGQRTTRAFSRCTRP